MDISENVKTLCKARGIKLYQLADRLQVTRQAIFKQTTGPANVASLEKIAGALAVPLWILLHPDPLAALAAQEEGHQDQTHQAPGPRSGDKTQDRTGRPSAGPATSTAGPAPAVLRCPYCHQLITITAARIDTGQDQDDSQR